MELDLTSEDLIVCPNPTTGNFVLGYPLTGTYALLFCQKDSTGTIIPIGGAAGIPLAESFLATAGQTTYTPTTFTATSICMVFINGILMTNTVDYTVAGGIITFASPQPLNTAITIKQW